LERGALECTARAGFCGTREELALALREGKRGRQQQGGQNVATAMHDVAMILRRFSDDLTMSRRRVASLGVVSLAVALLAGATATTTGPAERRARLEIWDLKPGTPVVELPDGFVD